MESKFKVAKIIDEYTIVINAGASNGIEVGDTFQILDKVGNEVLDPDTGEVIGSLDLIKGTVNVMEIYEKMCLCTAPYDDLYGSGLIGLTGLSTLDIINKKNSTRPKKKKLNIDLNYITGSLGESDEPIRIGDSVRLIKTSRK